MAIRWQKCLAIFGLVFVFALSACGGGEVTNDNQNQTNQNQDPNQNQEQCDPLVDVDCECDPEIHDFCEEENQNQSTAGCTSDDECSGSTPFCHVDAEICVSESFICTLLNCAGQRGVCDAPSRSCVDAEVCASADDCLEGNLCIAGSCEPEVEVCSTCTATQICEYDRNDLSISCVNPVCEPGTRSCDGDSLVACNQEGTAEQRIDCTEGCDPETVSCAQPRGDSCETPLIVEDGTSLEIDWSLYEANLQPAAIAGCASSARTVGSDVVFEFEIPAGEVGIVTLLTPEDYASLYILNDCPSGSSISCTNATGTSHGPVDGGYERSFWVHNDDEDPRTLLIVADSGNDVSAGPATIDFQSLPQICTPADRECAEAIVSSCDVTGTQWQETLTCNQGCSPDAPGTCATDDYTVCQDALPITGGTFSFTGELANLAAPASPFDSDEMCNSTPGGESTFAGPVAYFSRSLSAGDRLTLSLAANFDAAIWVASGCLDDGGQCSNAVNTNLSGSVESESLTYVASSGDEDIIVAVQAVEFSEGVHGEFTLDASLENALCADADNGDILGCEGDQLIYCTTSDFSSYYDCAGGCQDGACVQPKGDRCFDAIDATNGGTYTGSFREQDFSLNAHSACFGGTSTSGGNDTIYRVEIPNQHLLTATVSNTSSNVGVYLTDSCPGDGNITSGSCVASSFPDTFLQRHFTQGGTYYLVVASTNPNESANFDLDISITSATCLPGVTRCEDGITEVCDENGFTWSAFETCAASCEEVAEGEVSRQCGGLEEPNDHCSEPLLITGPSVIRGSFRDFVSRLPIYAGDCNEAGEVLSGPDAFYQFDMAPQSGLSATVNTSANVALIGIAGGCNDADSCSIKSLSSSDNTFEYYSPEGGTEYLVLKSRSASNADFEITFDYFPGECTPDIDSCEVDEFGQDVAVTCSSIGQRTETLCNHGCSEGVCLEKMGDMCVRPFDIDDHANTVETADTIAFNYSGVLTGFSDTFNAFDSATGNSCTGWETPGRDVVFAFEGWRNDSVEITLDSSFDGNIWVTTDCDNAAAQCLAGVDATFGAGTETLSLDINTTATYFVIVDGFQAGTSGTFDLDVLIEKGERLTEAEIEVIGAEDIEFDLVVGESDTAQISISNHGGWDLEYDISHVAEWLDFDPAEGTVAFEQTDLIEVSVECTEAGTHYGNFEINYGNPDPQMIPYTLTLNCALPPEGTLDVTVDGLPAGVDHDIDILNEDDEVVGTVPTDGSTLDLAPGDYTLQPQDISDDEDNYTAPEESFAIVSEETTSVTVTYSLDE